MRKEAFLLIGVLVLVVFAVQGVSAEILIGQTGTLYNWGDDFNVTITLSPETATKDFAVVDLICEDSGTEDFDREAFIAALIKEREDAAKGQNEEAVEDINRTGADETNSSEEIINDSKKTVVEENNSVFGQVGIYKSPQNIGEGINKKIMIETTLDSFFIGNLKGECYIRVKYGSDEVNGPRFSITKNIDVDLVIEGFAFNPGESFEISGSAFKSNGKAVNGFVEATLLGLNITASDVVEEGSFNFSYDIPYDALPGEFDILANVYERNDEGERVNEGNTLGAIKINQVTRNIGIAVESQSVNPESNIVYNILLYDQAGNEVRADSEVFIYDPEGNIFTEGLARSGDANRVYVEYNALPGYWKIEARYGDLETSKAIFIESLERVDFELSNETLTVTNTGNVPYRKPLEINIGENSRIQEMDLGVGEGITFTITAPDGDYGISVTDGVISEDLGTTFLTGRAISVREGRGIGISPLFIMGLVILILLTIAVFIVRKAIKKRKGTGATKAMGEPIAQRGGSSGEIKSGRKEDSTVVSLKIKNLKSLGNSKGIGSPIESINRALMQAKHSGAKIYVDEEYRIMVFSPILTKSINNIVKAIRIARDISKILGEHNSKYAEKIEFGIGVNSGEMIVESREGKFRFTSTGNTIGIAKKISGSSTGEVLISEKVRRKALGKLKITKIPATEYYRVRDIVDREEHKEFVSRFKKSLNKK